MPESRFFIEGAAHGHIGREAVAALIADKAFPNLDAPMRRLGAPDVPVPYPVPCNDALGRATIASRSLQVQVSSRRRRRRRHSCRTPYGSSGT